MFIGTTYFFIEICVSLSRKIINFPFHILSALPTFDLAYFRITSNQLQTSGKSRAKNKEDIVVDSFFWPMLKYSSKTVEDEYDVPIPERDEFEDHDEAIYSVWQHYVDYCINATASQCTSRNASSQKSVVNGNAADAKKFIKKYSHRSGIREALDQQRNDSVNRYISKTRLSAFQGLSRVGTTGAHALASIPDGLATAELTQERPPLESGISHVPCVSWVPHIALFMEPVEELPNGSLSGDVQLAEADTSSMLREPHSSGTVDGPPGLLERFPHRTEDEVEDSTPILSQVALNVSAIKGIRSHSDNEYPMDRHAVPYCFPPCFLLDSAMPSSDKSPSQSLDDLSVVKIEHDEQAVDSCGNQEICFDSSKLRTLEVDSDNYPTTRLSAESLEIHEELLRTSDDSSSFVTPLLDLTMNAAAKAPSTPSRMTEETDREMMSPAQARVISSQRAAPLSIQSLRLHLPDDVSEGATSIATETDSVKHMASRFLESYEGKSLLEAENMPPLQLSASPRHASVKVPSRDGFAVQYDLGDSCESAVRATLLSPPADPGTVKFAAFSPRVPEGGGISSLEADIAPKTPVSGFLLNAKGNDVGSSGRCSPFIPIVHTISHGGEISSPFGVDVGHDLVSSRDDSSSYRAFQTPSPATMASAVRAGKPALRREMYHY